MPRRKNNKTKIIETLTNKATTLCEVLRIHISKLETMSIIDSTTNEISYKIIAKISPNELQKIKIKTDESELIRIIKTLEPKNNDIDGSEFSFVKDLLILKVGKAKKYTDFQMTNGEFTLQVIDGQLENGEPNIIESRVFKRKICASGHNRSQKVMFVSADLYNKIEEISFCGIDKESMFISSKINAYIGLIATDSKVVSTPNIVVIDDYKKEVTSKYDIIKGSVKDSTYDVENDCEYKLSILPFDGAGLVCVERASKWSEELGLDYIPASFQFRCIPGIKGNLFTFDIEEFAKIECKTKITDLWGKEWDFIEDKIEVIMTKSQFKFYNLYNSFDDWKVVFEKEIYGYMRTFNISEFTNKLEDLKDNALMSYQPLQTLNFLDEEFETLCDKTVKIVKAIHKDPQAFLDYRNISDCDEEGDKNNEWDYIPPYYKALRYNNDLFYDEYVQGKIKRDLKTILYKSLSGKLFVYGNYQTLAPDIYGLAQYALGEEVTGLLGTNKIYSNYWTSRRVKEVDLIRSPHIANEHCPVTVVSNDGMKKWYKYQTVNIVTGFYDTNVMKMNSADHDGDCVLTVNDKTILNAAKRNISNTIIFENKDKKNESKTCSISDIASLIHTDSIGFKNNIGSVINKISILWSMEQDEKIKDYIKIMSIIGSLTIDFVKTGEKADIPEDIKKLLKSRKKPYFLKYTNKKAVSKEKMIQREAKRYDVENKSKYDDYDCTMNNICHYLEKNLKGLRIGKDEGKFEFSKMIQSTFDVTNNKAYIQLKSKLLKLQAEFIEICKKFDTVKDDDSKDYSQRQYQRFYSYCKVELQNTYIDFEKNIDNNKILDYLLYMYYCDKDVIGECADKSILWNTFPTQMINRAKGNFNTMNVDLENLKKCREKNLKVVKKLKENSKIVSIPFLDKLQEAHFTKEDRKIMNDKVKDKDARKLLFVLSIIDRKINSGETKNKPIEIILNGKNQVNYSRLCKLSDIDVRHFDEKINILKDCDCIEVDIKNLYKPKYSVKFPYNNGEICATIKNINDCNKAIKNNFRYIAK